MPDPAPPEVTPLAVSLAEVKAYLRLANDDDDALLAGLVRTAMALCEAFTGQWLLIRAGSERLAASRDWQRLIAAPVIEIVAVEAGSAALPADAWTADIDAAGDAWLRLTGSAAPAVARFRAGLAADWNGLPEPLRQGIVRLTTHFYSHRDAADAGPPPAAVAALWRSWRRVRLG
ncbi:hypothetical protein IP88_16365 [alpha proteobacterium AAP81b]|nr:hypothetical protein IP88_16365 [alpha proteobacterium AAP81b]